MRSVSTAGLTGRLLRSRRLIQTLGVCMNASEFLAEFKPRLVETLRKYLGGELSHQDASDFSWSVISAWENRNMVLSNPYQKGEHVFWASIWSTQHLADEEHWKDGCTHRELGRYLHLLESNGELARDEEGNRPGDT